MPSELSKRILPCVECSGLPDFDAATVRPFLKPCAQFDIYSTWKPNHVRIAFIAESPPGNSDGYFYDPKPHANYKEILRKALFELLELAGERSFGSLEIKRLLIQKAPNEKAATKTTIATRIVVNGGE